MTVYVLITRNDGLWLTGPFDNEKLAADYGATCQSELWEDDPRWQVINLEGSADHYKVFVYPPLKEITVEPGAYDRACKP